MTRRFEITWMFDVEERDAASLVGRLVITDGVDSIDEPSVFIDSWFAALIRASKTASEDASEVEIPEHPQRLVVWCDEKEHVHLAFRNSEVVAESLEGFKHVLKQRAQDFLNEAASIPGKPDPSQQEIRAFIESS
jgi:hypothetical protein